MEGSDEEKDPRLSKAKEETEREITESRRVATGLVSLVSHTVLGFWRGDTDTEREAHSSEKAKKKNQRRSPKNKAMSPSES